MHPEQIKSALRISGTTPSQIARDLGLSRMSVSHVIHGRSESRRIKVAISEAIGKPVESIWQPKSSRLYKRVAT